MTDERYTLAQTNRERKTTARSASHRVNGSKSKRCTLPSDTLTPAQIRKLSGPVLTYSMDRPYTLAELKGWPADLRHEYMQSLLDRYQPSHADLAGMLQCSKNSITYALKQHFGITRKWGGPRVRSSDSTQGWQTFLNGEVTVPDPEPLPDPEPITEPEPPIPWSAATSVTLEYNDTTLADAVKQLLTDPLLPHLTSAYHITIHLERRQTT